MRAVNLLPADRHDAKKGSGAGSNQRSVLVVCAIASVALIGGLVFMVLQSNSSVSNKQKQLAALQAKVAAGSSQLGAGSNGDRSPGDGGRPGRRPARLGSVPPDLLEGDARGRLGDEPRGDDSGGGRDIRCGPGSRQAAAAPVTTTAGRRRPRRRRPHRCRARRAPTPSRSRASPTRSPRLPASCADSASSRGSRM